MSEQNTAVAEETSFADWAKARTFSTPSSADKEDSTAGADKTAQAAPETDKTDGVTAATEPEEIKAADPDDEKEDDETTAEALKNPGAKKRLGGWARKADKAEKAAEALRKEVETLKAQVAAKPANAAPVKTEPAKVEQKAETRPRPVAEDFKSVDDFYDALVDWKVEQKLDAKEQTKAEKDKAEAEKARTEGVMQGWDKQVATTVAEKDYSDFVDVVIKGGIQYPDFIAQALYEDENGPKVAYQLAKDAALLKEIIALTPAKAIAKLGRLSAKFDAPADVKTEPVIPQEKPTPKQSAAPAPIRASSAPTQTSVKAAEEMTTSEWLQKRNKATGHR